MSEKASPQRTNDATRERSATRTRPAERQAAQPGVDALFGLQRELGNQAMLRLLQSGLIQTKLRVSQPGDADEEEADRIADQVVSRQATSTLHRKCACSGGTPCSKCAGEQEDAVIHRSAARLNSFPLSLQRAAADQAANTAVAPPAQHVAGASASAGRPPALIVDDGAESLGPGQMRKSEFLEQLRAAACATADAVLAAVGHSTKACPYIAKWLNFYQNASAEHLERALLKYAPEARGARSAREYISIANRHVQRATLEWAKTGKVSRVPEEIQKQPDGAGAGGGLLGSVRKSVSTGVAGAVLGFFAGKTKEERAEAPGLQRKARDGADTAATNAADVRGQLGSGRALDSRVQGQMSSAFGYDFSGVRVHTDSDGARLSSDLNARAFTIGNDVAFAAGEYKPGTLVGDALIAHELAHVVQQGGGSKASGPMLKEDDNRGALEQDANRSATSAVAALWSRTRGGLAGVTRSAVPRLRAGLRLSRCSSKTKPKQSGRSVLAPLLVEWKKAGFLDPPLRPADVGEFPPLALTNPEDAAEFGGPVAAGMAVPKMVPTTPAPVEPAPGRPPLRLVPPSGETPPGGEPAPSPSPVVISAPVAAVAAFLAVFLWSRDAGGPGDTIPIDPISDLPYPSRDDYEWEKRLTPRQQDYLRGLPKTSPTPRLPTPSPAPKPRPTPTPLPTPSPAPKPRPVPKECEETARKYSKPDCRITATTAHAGAKPGAVTVADLFCEQQTNDPCEYIVRAGGTEHIRARFDAVRGGIAYECKCGYEDHVRKARRGNKVSQGILDKTIAQIRQHVRIVKDCGLKYRVIVSSASFAAYLRAELGTEVDVIHEEFEPCD